MKIAQIQSHVYSDKMKNLEQLDRQMEELAWRKPDLVMLGEMFCCPYETKLFPVYGGRVCAGAGRRRQSLQHSLCV